MTKLEKSNVTDIVTTQKETPSFKRDRMKTVRTKVARAVKQNKRVDLMGFEGTDIARSQIALQDMLHKSQERHQKATKFLAQRKEADMILAEIINKAADEVAELYEQLGDERRSHRKTCNALLELSKENEGLKLALREVLHG